MKVKLIGKNQIISLTLPQRVYGNYWIVNEDKENLINIEAVHDKWVMNSNSEVKIMENDRVIESTILVENRFYHFFNVQTEEKYRIYVTATYASTMLTLNFVESDNLTFTIGNSASEESGRGNYISFESPGIHHNQIEVTRNNGVYHIKNLRPDVKVYVNDYLLNEGYIKYGDVVFVEGLIFSFVGNMLLLGTIDNKVKYVSSKFTVRETKQLDYSQIDNLPDVNVELYGKNDYFLSPPRFSEIIETKTIDVDSPPGKQEDNTMPIALTMGPMVIMGMSSAVSGAIALINVITGESTLKDNFTQIMTAVCMLCAMLVFPSITKWYQKKKIKEKEALRQEKYKEYLVSVGAEIKEECTRQKRILIENNVSLKDAGEIILYKKRNLWERKPMHQDFLELRLGIGNTRPKIQVNYQKEHFKLVEDNLEQELQALIRSNNIIENVPVTHSFRDKYISGLIGKYSILRRYVDGLILQMITYHSYDNLKIVILTNENNKSFWEKYKNLPYCWNNEKTVRYFATNKDELLRVSAELESYFVERTPTDNKEKNKVPAIKSPHFMIITDDISFTSKTNIINDILKDGEDKGFSILFLTDKLNSLPSECSSFVSIEPNVGGVFENELLNKKQEFHPDFMPVTIEPYIYAASNIPLEFSGAAFELPSVYTFLEMYDAGNVEQLNAFNRWQKNDPTTSLACPVGIDENGELFKLDLHEKVHGPHGLIAGMTGSGKSEFIITYILSMAVNYDPKEVQFVLIDYKGGGLAGAFENKETGEKLPHLAGTITNLDVSEINRSLSSLQSELKRRQRVFNEARDKCNESTIDIYKYQKLYREGKVSEPVAHLLIISDEFAELKAQQREFMDELISAARIGRSLGVHLILATQKPAGVVDDQIWSNSKFRVCLKVQDKADSNDMIKVADAAYIKETGRFFLQVGFNELFAKGQSAWCGAPYYEADKRKKMVDTSLSFVNNIGEKIKDIDNDKQNLRGVHKGEEITNILKYLQELGKAENIKVKQLWLDAIPANIFVDNLKKKYDYQKEDFILDVVVGEYDAPKEQEQNILTVPLTREGNLLIYGAVGSGKENLVSTMVYSLISTYSPEEVNIFVLDFGSEVLRMYSKAPHVGAVLGSADADEIGTLMKMIAGTIEKRKKLFSEYNGSYEYYCQASGNTLPSFVIIINGYESFFELYTDYADQLVQFTREGSKYGIIFIATVSATNSIRMKVSQNFNQKLVLQMNDEFDYRQLLGKTDVMPSKIPGRGLAKRGGIYEFQSAYPVELAEINPFMENVIKELNVMYPIKAKGIPKLPEIVTTDFVAPELLGLEQLPIGVAKESLNILSVDLVNNESLLVSALKVELTHDFIETFIYQLKTVKNTAVYVIDAQRIINDRVPGVNYFTTSFDKVFTSFKKIVDDLNELYVQNDYDPTSLNGYADMIFVITGMNKIKTILADQFEELVGKSIQASKKLSKIRYIFVDGFDNLKKVEYDLWYKDIVNSTRGIWIGNGLAEQSVIRLTGNTRGLAPEIPNGFGYNIVSGVPTLFKYLSSYDVGDSEESA